MKIKGTTEVCVIIGDPVEHSLSPIMHNAGYETLGIDDKFVFIALHVSEDNLKSVIEGLRKTSIRGITCTIPHKESIIPMLDWVHEDAQKIGAVNTVVNEGGLLKGYNTDWIGVMNPIANLVGTRTPKTAALFGAGGAARANIFALQKLGIETTIFNRTYENALELAGEFGIEAQRLDELDSLYQFELIINSTSVGLKDNLSIVPIDLIHKDHIVFDNIYKKGGTHLINHAKSKQALTIDGLEMLLFQGFEQFKFYTQHDAPKESMRSALTKYLN